MTKNATQNTIKKTLNGHNYTLCPYTPEDVTSRYVSWLNDPEITQHLEKRQIVQTIDTAMEYVRSFYNQGERYIWAIIPNESEELVGTIILDDVNRVSGSGAFGITIGASAFHGTGTSAESIRLVADFAFSDLGLNRLWATTTATNYGMLFTFKELGFMLEGRLRQACKLGDDTHVDMLVWGTLSGEFQTGNVDGD